MRRLLENARLLLKRILSYIPTPLPVGATEFDAWAASIIQLTGQYAEDTSMRFAIASILIHADSKKGSLSKHYFIARLRKSAANQVASQVFQDIKLKQDAAQKAAQATEVTVVPTNGTPSDAKDAGLQKA